MLFAKPYFAVNKQTPHQCHEMQINYFIILISVRKGAVTSKASQSAQNFAIQLCETGEGCFQIQADEKESQFENTWKVSHLISLHSVPWIFLV